MSYGVRKPIKAWKWDQTRDARRGHECCLVERHWKGPQDSESCEPKGHMRAADRGCTALAVCLVRWRRATRTVGSRGSEGTEGVQGREMDTVVADTGFPTFWITILVAVLYLYL